MSIEQGDNGNIDTESDLMLAQMLQLQFDEEYEKMIKARENKMNGTSKGNTILTLRLHETNNINLFLAIPYTQSCKVPYYSMQYCLVCLQQSYLWFLLKYPLRYYHSYSTVSQKKLRHSLLF